MQHLESMLSEVPAAQRLFDLCSLAVVMMEQDSVHPRDIVEFVERELRSRRTRDDGRNLGDDAVLAARAITSVLCSCEKFDAASQTRMAAVVKFVVTAADTCFTSGQQSTDDRAIQRERVRAWPGASERGEKSSASDDLWPSAAAAVEFVLTTQADLADDTLALLDLLVALQSRDVLRDTGFGRMVAALLGIWPSVKPELCPRWARCLYVLESRSDDLPSNEESLRLPTMRFLAATCEYDAEVCTKFTEHAMPLLVTAFGAGSRHGEVSQLHIHVLQRVRTACQKHNVAVPVDVAFLVATVMATFVARQRQNSSDNGVALVKLRKPSMAGRRVASSKGGEVLEDGPSAEYASDQTLLSIRDAALDWLRPYAGELQRTPGPEHNSGAAYSLSLLIAYAALRWGAAVSLSPVLSWYIHDEDTREPVPLSDLPLLDVTEPPSSSSKRRASVSGDGTGNEYNLETLVVDGSNLARLMPSRPAAFKRGCDLSAVSPLADCPADAAVTLDAIAFTGAFVGARDAAISSAAVAVQLRMFQRYYQQKSTGRVHSPEPGTVEDEEQVVTEVLSQLARQSPETVEAVAVDFAGCWRARPELWRRAANAYKTQLTTVVTASRTDLANRSKTTPTTTARTEAVGYVYDQLATPLRITSSFSGTGVQPTISSPAQLEEALEGQRRADGGRPPLSAFLARVLPSVVRDARGLLALARFIDARYEASDASEAIDTPSCVQSVSRFVAESCRAIADGVPEEDPDYSTEDLVNDVADRKCHVLLSEVNGSRSARPSGEHAPPAHARYCPAGHPLRLYRGMDWECSLACGQRPGPACLACRECRHHVCGSCSAEGKQMGMLDTLRDVAKAHDVDLSDSNVCFAVVTPSGRFVRCVDWWTVARVSHIAGVSNARQQLTLYVYRDGAMGGGAPSAVSTSLEAPLRQHVRLFHEAVRFSKLTSALAFRAVRSIGRPKCGVISGMHTQQLNLVAQLLQPADTVAARRQALDQDVVSFSRIAGALGPERAQPNSSYGEFHTVERASFSVPRDLTALDVIENHAKSLLSLRKLSVNFEGEAGFGDGPTQEFFIHLLESAYSREELWMKAESGGEAGGTLIPVLRDDSDTATRTLLYSIGLAIARGVRDGFLVPMRLHPIVWRIFFANAWNSSAVKDALFRAADPAMAEHVLHLRGGSADDIEAMCLEFDDGRDVTYENAELYVTQFVERFAEPTYRGISCLAAGLQRFLSSDTLAGLFDPMEMATACGGSNDANYFTKEALTRAICPAHGYTWASPQLPWLVDALAGLDEEERREFVQFLTGCGMLPSGGWDALGRPVTVVVKDFDNGSRTTLPSCSTCFLYLKVPAYDNPDTLERCLKCAIREGRESFALS